MAEPNSVVSLAFGLGFLSVGISMGYFVGLEVVIVKTGVERSELWILSDTISYALWGAFGIALVAFASGVVWLQRVGDMDE